MAYVLEGQRWASQPITWDFAASTLPSDSALPFSSLIGAADARAVVSAAFEAWSRICNVQFVYAPQDNSGVGIRVGWGSFTPSATSVELGQTNYSYFSESNEFVPDVLVRLLDPAKSPLGLSGGTLTYAQYKVTLYQVALHEIGHAIGLDHDTTDTNAVMNPYLTSSNRTLASPDIAGAQAIYGAPATSLLVLGSNQETVSGSQSGAASTVFGGSGSLDYTGNTGLIVLGSGSALVQDGTVTVFAGSGTLQAVANPHGEFILAGGSTSIAGGGAGSTDIVFGGAGGFRYAGGAGTASVIGGSGSDTVTGASGGGFYSGGSQGNNQLTATGVGSVLIGGGNGDVLRAAATGYDYLVAGAGNETLVGAGGGTDRFYLGSGNDQVQLGSGDSQAVTGSGIAAFIAQGGTSALFGGTGGADLFIESAGSTMSITGFRVGQDHLRGGATSSVVTAGNATVLHFSDGATVTLNGVTVPSGSSLFG